VAEVYQAELTARLGPGAEGFADALVRLAPDPGDG
jgi:hypothetical protein